MRMVAVGLSDLLVIEQVVMGCVRRLTEFVNREEQFVMVFPGRNGGMIKIATSEEAISMDPYLVQIPDCPSEFKYYEWVTIISMKVATALAPNGWLLGTISNPHSYDNKARVSQKGPFTVWFGRRLM